MTEEIVVKPDDTSVEYINDRLRNIRLYRDKDAKVVAQEMGFTKQMLSNYESNRDSNPTYKTIEKFSEVYDISPEYFYLKLTPKEYLEFEKAKDIFNQINQMPIDLKRYVLLTIDLHHRENLLTLGRQQYWKR
jgi:transcriptional regulator with XRE-family HTH domain